MFLLISMALALEPQEIAVFEPIGPVEQQGLRLSDSLRSTLRQLVSEEYTVLTRENLSQQFEQLEQGLTSQNVLDVGTSLKVDYVVSPQLHVSESKLDLYVWIYEVSSKNMIQSMHFTGHSFAELEQHLERDLIKSLPKQWGSPATALVINISPPSGEMSQCLSSQLSAKGVTGRLEISLSSVPSPTSSVYLPSAVGSLNWSSNEGRSGRSTWVAFGASEADAKSNALSFRNLNLVV